MPPLRYEITLTDDELRTAWLTEDRSRRGLLQRTITALLILFGVATLALEGAASARWVGVAALALGLLRLSRPFLVLRRVLSDRRRAGPERVVVTLDDAGIVLERGGKSARFPWSEVSAAGERVAERYFYYELRGRHRAPIPHRVVDDPEALRAAFAAHTRWTAPRAGPADGAPRST